MKKQAVKKWLKGFLTTKPDKTQQQHFKIQFPKLQKKQEGWTQAQAQIINHLISMDSMIKISRHLNEYQYATLFTINQVLCDESIDLDKARKCLVGGIQAINDGGQIKYMTKHLPYQYYSVRSLLWKICVGYLVPNSKEKWVSGMEKNLVMYKKYVCQFIVQPIEKKLGISNNSVEVRKLSPNTQQQQKAKETKQVKDHPLNFSHQSKWGNYFKDVQLWRTIQKDTRRTRKNCKFFEQPHEISIQQQQISIKASLITFSQETRPQTYADSLTRIIFIYLKNHPNQPYYQGMNQIVALIYYCFTNKNSQYFRRVSQSDTYFVFEQIMNKLPKKHFQKGEQYVKDFLTLMKKLDLRLYEQLQKNKSLDMIKLTTMRWFLSGFLTQYTIDECLIIWDAFIAWPSQYHQLTECFTYMALSVIHLNRQKILSGENIALVFSKIDNPSIQVVEKTQNLCKLFPKLLSK